LWLNPAILPCLVACWTIRAFSFEPFAAIPFAKFTYWETSTVGLAYVDGGCVRLFVSGTVEACGTQENSETRIINKVRADQSQ
jgi:hypothetical protein